MPDLEGRSERNGLYAAGRRLMTEWGLCQDGLARSGDAGVVFPVRCRDGSPAALKVQSPGPEVDAAILGLQHWDGHGAVRLLASDPGRGALLLERLHAGRSLESIPDDDAAIAVVAQLLGRLHAYAAPEGLPHLGSVAGKMLEDAARVLPSLHAENRSRMHRWVRAVEEVAAEPGEALLHWDLHYGNVLAADREPWLAIDPEPLVGDPGFDLWPALDSGWSARAADGNAVRTVRRRFDTLTEVLELDRQRAAAWTRARLLQNALWDIADGSRHVSMAARVVDEALRWRG